MALAGAVAGGVAAEIDAASTIVLDTTYSCAVRAERYVDFDLHVNFPPLESEKRPAQVQVFTTPKTMQRNGIAFIVPQLYFDHFQNSLKVDTANCHKSSRRVALTPKGLPAPQTATRHHIGEFHERCATTKRVLLHYRITLQNGTPEHAVVLVRNADRKSKPVAYFDWAPHKIVGYLAKDCVALPPSA